MVSVSMGCDMANNATIIASLHIWADYVFIKITQATRLMRRDTHEFAQTR